MSEVTVRPEPWSDWPIWDLRVLEPADGRVVVLSLVAGIGFDVGVRTGVATLGGTLAVAIAAVSLVATGRFRTATSRACLAGALVLGSFLTLRTSPWVLLADLAGAATLLVAAGMFAREERWSDLPGRLLASRAVVALAHGIGAAAFLVAPLRRSIRPMTRSSRAASTVRGLALALPLVLVLSALLASADVVFASALSFRLPVPSDLAGHLALVSIGALAIGGVVRTASASSDGEVPTIDRRLGTTEWTIILGSVVLLFSAFAAAQVVTMTGGATHVLETEGLTYAEYARTGYAQLLGVATLTGTALAALRVVADTGSPSARRRFTILSELTLALTGLVLVVAVRRLALYEGVYGWTMLRLVAKASAIWLGATLALAAARFAGVRPDRDWFLTASAAVGFAIVLALNVVNPEAVVARHNLGLAREIDAVYLADGLSDDAVPTVVSALPTLPEPTRAAARALVCANDDGSAATGLSWNRSERAADRARDRVC